MEGYVIERIGKFHTIRKAYDGGAMTVPTDGKRYKTETAAREAAVGKGIEIKASGDIWQIMSQLRKAERA